MIRGVLLECRAGNAQKFICPKCRAHHWQQLTESAVYSGRSWRDTVRLTPLQTV